MLIVMFNVCFKCGAQEEELCFRAQIMEILTNKHNKNDINNKTASCRFALLYYVFLDCIFTSEGRIPHSLNSLATPNRFFFYLIVPLFSGVFPHSLLLQLVICYYFLIHFSVKHTVRMSHSPLLQHFSVFCCCQFETSA